MNIIGYFAQYAHSDEFTRFGMTPEEAVQNTRDAAEYNGCDIADVKGIEVFAAHAKAKVSAKIEFNWE